MIFEDIERRLKSIETQLAYVISRLDKITTRDRIGGVALACEVTGIKSRTVYDRVKKGTIPHTRKGGKLFFSEATLILWMTTDLFGENDGTDTR